MCAWWCCTVRTGRPAALRCAHAVGPVKRMRVGDKHFRQRPRSAPAGVAAPSRTPSTSTRSSMSPMCWLSQAYFPSATARVFLRSAPTARVGGTAAGKATGSGAYPRERRTGNSRAHDHPHHGVVARDQDRPVVHQPAVGQLRKPFECIIIGVSRSAHRPGCPMSSRVRSGRARRRVTRRAARAAGCRRA